MVDLNREPMPRQDSKHRRRNFGEVALGYSDKQAFSEAKRCIQCPKRPCVAGCPVGIDIPGFIDAILKKDMRNSARILKNKNSLPAICGRVCPQESQCEAVCTLAKKRAPIAIGRLERYVADWERQNQSSVASTNP
ncbi:MAG: dihydropyrimidine dehydrogenase, partial [Dehalococcoidia bacterium]